MWHLVSLLLFLYISKINADPCTTNDGKQGNCVFIDYCPSILESLKNLTEVTNETLSKFWCNNRQDYVCCSVPRTSALYGKELSDRTYCGLQHTDDYASDQVNTSIDEFPWVAAIVGLHKKFLLKGIICHGSLITARYVLTAAQCFDNTFIRAYGITGIILGEYNIKTKTDCVELPQLRTVECSISEQFQIEEVVKHPFFKPEIGSNDIALARMIKEVSYSDYVRPICLPVQGTKFATPGDVLYTTGWGKKSVDDSNAVVKKKIQTILLTNEECSRKYEGAKVPHVNYICTLDSTNNSAYSCTGDSGAPVMFKHRNQWHLEGIISKGRRCGRGYPGVHTRVTSYLEWIKQNIRP